MTDNKQPEALRLADWLQAAVQTYPQMSEDEPGGYASEVDQIMDEASDELRRQHTRIAELEAQLEAVGAGGVQALSAAPAEADSVLEDADPIRALIAEHAAVLDQNESAYFELCYHRATGWMAWITDKPLCMPPVVNPDRKVLAQGQGDTADEACRDAARKQGGA